VTLERLTGTYLLGGEPLIVAEYQGDLVLSTLGVPPEFAARIVVDGGRFRVEGGPLDGAVLEFADGEPCPGVAVAGAFELTRAPAGASLPGGRGLLAPLLDLSTREIALYQVLLAEMERSPDGAWLELEERPRWRFVEWLTRQQRVIFHGSPKPDIDVFAPVRSSVEIMDHTGTGNLAAVYGTPYGLWAMWFAVLDRSGLLGSIRNGILGWTDRDGRELHVYHFSVHHEYVGGDIWRSGTLYLLPREPFRPNSFFPGGPDTGEWASPKEVEPMKRLAVDPEDFPFLGEVGGHDDTELIRAGDLSDVVLDHVLSARRMPGGIELMLEWDDSLAAVIDDYFATTRTFTPDVERRLTRVDAGGALLAVRGAAGFLQSLEGSLARRDVPIE